MQYLAVILLCLQAGVGNGRTEEDQSSMSNINELSQIVHKECFYQESTECPSRNRNNCPCKKIIFTSNGMKGNASLCCNVNSETLKHGLSCAGIYKFKKFYSLLKHQWFFRICRRYVSSSHKKFHFRCV